MTRLAGGRATNERSVCIFERGGRTLGLPVWAVREVLSGETASSVPCAPPNVAGAINVRGEPLALVQIDDWIGARRRPHQAADQILVLECDGLRAGLVVDRVHGIGQCERPLEELAAIAAWPGPLTPREWVASEAAIAVLDPHQLVAALVQSARAAFAGFSSRKVGGAGASAPTGER